MEIDRFSLYATHPQEALFCYFINYFLLFINYIITVFPIDQVLHLHRQNGSMNVFIQLENNIQKNESQLQLKIMLRPWQRQYRER